MSEWLETRRDEFLCGIYDRRFDRAETTFLQIRDFAAASSYLTEYHQKILSQSLVIFKRFRELLTSNCSGQMPAAAHEIKHLLASYAGKKSSTGHQHVDYPRFKSLLDIPEPHLKTLYQTVITFQLTSGCSHFCRRCNEWALPGVRSHFSFKAVQQIILELAAAGNSGFTLYGASDPLDWQDGHYTICHILEFLSENCIELELGLLTKIPKGKESLIYDLAQREADIAVSVTTRNRNRFEKIEKKLPTVNKQHDFDDLLIPACLDEDFSTVKSSITDTYGTEISPDGAFTIIPTFTSALNPFGHKKIPVTGKTSFFLVKQTGRQALRIDYFKPLEAVTPDGKKFRLRNLLDTQVETLLLDNGSNDLNVPGMTNIREYFDTFKAAAMLQRRKMLPSVMKKLKKKHFGTSGYQKLPHPEKRRYRANVQGYLDFCRPLPVLSSKLCAVSFFLSAIHAYARQNPVRVNLIRHLRKSYIQTLNKAFPHFSSQTDITEMFMNSSKDSFLLFEFLKFRILTSPSDNRILAFIHTHKSDFDSNSGRFVPRKKAGT